MELVFCLCALGHGAGHGGGTWRADGDHMVRAVDVLQSLVDFDLRALGLGHARDLGAHRWAVGGEV